MTTIAEVYTALAAQVAPAIEDRCYDHVPGSANYPVAFLMPPAVESEGLSSDTLTLAFELVVLVSAFDHARAPLLFPYMEPSGDQSIRARIQDNRSLGFDDVDINPGDWRPLGLEEMAAYNAFGAAMTIVAAVGNC